MKHRTRRFVPGGPFLAVASALSAASCIPLLPQNDPKLPGTWSGVLNADATVAISTTGPADLNSPDARHSPIETPITITFDAQGVPDKLVVYGLGIVYGLKSLWGPSASHLEPAAFRITAVQPGDVSAVTIEEVTYTVTVQDATYSPSQAHATLAVTTSWDLQERTTSTKGTLTGSGALTQTIELSWIADGPKLNWVQTAEGTTEALVVWKRQWTDITLTSQQYWTAQRIVVTGTLTRPPLD
jgi:hypothetical protein